MSYDLEINLNIELVNFFLNNKIFQRKRAILLVIIRW